MVVSEATSRYATVAPSVQSGEGAPNKHVWLSGQRLVGLLTDSGISQSEEGKK